MESGLRRFVLLLFMVLISRFEISSAGCNDQTDKCTCVSNTVMENLVQQASSLTQSLKTLIGNTNASTQSLKRSLKGDTNSSPARDVEINGTPETESTNRAEGEGHDLQRQVAELREELKMTRVQLSALQNSSKPFKTPVAFSVRFKGDHHLYGLAIPRGAKLRFDKVVYNAGDGYDAKTGIFTAPLTGTYAFFLNFMGAYSGTLFIRKNGAFLDGVWSNNNGYQGASLVTSHLKEGDEMWVTNYAGARVRGGFHTFFSGFLLQAD